MRTMAIDPHTAMVRRMVLAGQGGCARCLRTGAGWVQLRACLTCGHIGCCDSSPNRHARAHAFHSGHPIVAPVIAGERWRWCYFHRAYV